jgi:hypothetical protein
MPEGNRARKLAPDGMRQSAMRKVATMFRFYWLCGNRHCLRARGCRGDSVACVSRWFRHLPEEEKIWFRVSTRARLDGASASAANAAGLAAAAEYLREQHRAALDPHEGAVEPPRHEPPPREAPQPRVRIA